MATLSRTARIRITTGLGAWREWTAIATNEETPAGSSVTVTWTVAVSGASPPDPDTIAELRFYNSAGTLIRTVALAADTTPQTATFHFTNDGTSTGAARSGTVELAAYVRRVVAGTTIYEVESDGTPNTPGAGNTATTDRGYIVATTTATDSISNVAYAGAKTEPAQFGENLFRRLVLGAQPYRSESLTLAIGSVVTASVASATTTFDMPAQAVDDRFPAEASTQTTGAAIPANSGFVTGRAWTTLTTTATDAISVDPRVTASHHFQLNDNIFAVAKHDPGYQILDTESGFLWTIVRTARGDGVNGLTLTQTLTPVKPGTPVTAGSTTTTQDSQAGVSGRLDWTATKPNGIWNKAVDITAPATIDADTHLVNPTAEHVLLAPDPNIEPFCTLSMGIEGNEADHMHAGEVMVVSLVVHNRKTGRRVAADAGSAHCIFVRYEAALARWEFLDTDGITWREWTVGGATDVVMSLPLVESPAGSRIYSRSFPAESTVGWDATDIVAVAADFKVDGTPYDCHASRELTGRAHAHSHVSGALVSAQTTIT